jgi:hypothetical protein
MTVRELIDKLGELYRPDYTVDARYAPEHAPGDGALPDCHVDDLFVIDLPHGEGYVTLVLGDPS